MPHKQDPKEVSKEYYEIRDIARKYGAPRELVKKLQSQTRSREQIEFLLEKEGYSVQPKKEKQN